MTTSLIKWLELCADAGAFVYDVEEDKLNEAGVRAAVYDEMTFYHPEALNMKRL